MGIYNHSIKGKNIDFNIGEFAKQADGSIFVTFGNTDFLVTVVKKELEQSKGFFPLIINYEERMYSLGKIPSNYLRRESKPTDSATLNGRLIDRALRPLFPKGFDSEVQIVITVLGYDKDYEPQMIAITAASLGCIMANLPLSELVSGITLAKVEGELVVNPNLEQRQNATFELKAAGTDKAINMIEFQGEETSEEEVLEVIEEAHSYIKELIGFQSNILNELQITKSDFKVKDVNQDIYNNIKEKYESEFLSILKENKNRQDRAIYIKELETKIIEQEVEQEVEESNDIKEAFNKLYKELFIDLIIKEDYRLDGRTQKQIRSLNSRTNILKKTHGSAVFTRGETQALAVTTLGVKRDEQTLDGLEDKELEQFILQYNFPPYSVGETGRIGAPGRREIGHGNLAYKAINKMIPTYDEFPYTIRVVSEVLESNGSSSQATVCATTMSLMDAGVPIKKPVAGIAMGLIQKDDQFLILSDIAGIEDHFGDMDFKVAGTKTGITAIQMDIKISGITKEVFRKCLEQASVGKNEILSHMLSVIDKPRESVNANAPKIETLKINKEQIKDVIGKGGDTINKIIEDTGVKIDIEEDGHVFIYSTEEEGLLKAKNIIQKITKVYEEGQEYLGKVTRVEKYGAFVTFDGNQEALLHISTLSKERVEKVEDVVNLGDEVKIQITEVDNKKRIKAKLIDR